MSIVLNRRRTRTAKWVVAWQTADTWGSTNDGTAAGRDVDVEARTARVIGWVPRDIEVGVTVPFQALERDREAHLLIRWTSHKGVACGPLERYLPAANP